MELQFLFDLLDQCTREISESNLADLFPFCGGTVRANRRNQSFHCENKSVQSSKCRRKALGGRSVNCRIFGFRKDNFLYQLTLKPKFKSTVHENMHCNTGLSYSHQ
jgi:hypothetical protein